MDQVALDTCSLTYTKPVLGEDGKEVEQVLEVGVQALEDHKDDGVVTANVVADVADPGPPANDGLNPFETGGETGGFPVWFS